MVIPFLARLSRVREGDRVTGGTKSGGRKDHLTAATALLVLGLAQMTGDATGLASLRGIAAATAASPSPRILSPSRGFESWSTRSFVQWPGEDGSNVFYELTPERWARVRGPSVRRRVYLAALGDAPTLAMDETTEPMLRAVMLYALCDGAPLLHEMGIDTSGTASAPGILYQPRPGAKAADLPRILNAPCESASTEPSAAP